MLNLTRKAATILSMWLSTIVGGLCFIGVTSFFDFSALSWLFAVLSAMLSSYLMFTVLSRSDAIRLESLRNGFLNLLDSDFSVTLTQHQRDEIDDLLALYNLVSDKLRRERQHIHQRELLLDTVIQNSSLALLLMDHQEKIVYSNSHAKNVLNSGRPINGLALNNLLQTIPLNLRTLIVDAQDGLFTVDAKDGVEPETYHLSNGRFVLNTLEHRLLLIKKMTRELKRQEVATWKKVIRVISHELNNSLAPISSMAHSGKIAIEQQQYEHLTEVMETISECSLHLSNFVGDYAKVAKLPEPRRARVNWFSFVKQLQMLSCFTQIGELPAVDGYFDSMQIHQVLLNVLKNAHESGSPVEDICLHIEQKLNRIVMEVSDRGPGMSKEIMSQALLPFYTTKKSGSGVGLALCREIIDLHDGTLVLQNRLGGGLVVHITMPLQK